MSNVPKSFCLIIILNVYHNHCCDNDAVETAATIVGIATLAAILAD